MKSLAVIILAAGKGTRMKSDVAKILHSVAGRPMLAFALDLARSLCPDRLVAVVGCQRNVVRERFRAEDLLFVDQEKQLGTGHAVLAAKPALKNFQGTVLILCGDVPLLSQETVKQFIKFHSNGSYTLSVLTTRLENPGGYGRIFRGEKGQLLRIVEQKDLPAGGETIREINTGIYCVEAKFLFPALAGLSNRNAQKEYYLTDIAAKACSLGEKAAAFLTEDSKEVMGINTRLDLAEANQYVRWKIAERHMREGVTLIDPRTAYIDHQVEIGRDSVIYPNCYLLGKTSLGKNCLIEPGCKITDSRLGNKVTIKASSVVSESILEDRVEVGPFAHLRQQTLLREGSRIGNFVEVKKAVIGKGTRAGHLSYLGDAAVGEKVNIGAGVITCNYDGRRKHATFIEDGVFVGSNTALVAPIKIGRKAFIAAGSTITQEVPPEHLAVGRAGQANYKRKSRRKD